MFPGRERQSQASSPGGIALGFVMWLLLNGDGGNKNQSAGTQDGSSLWSFLLLPAGGLSLVKDPGWTGGMGDAGAVGTVVMKAVL